MCRPHAPVGPHENISYCGCNKLQNLCACRLTIELNFQCVFKGAAGGRQQAAGSRELYVDITVRLSAVITVIFGKCSSCKQWRTYIPWRPARSSSYANVSKNFGPFSICFFQFTQAPTLPLSTVNIYGLICICTQKYLIILKSGNCLGLASKVLCSIW